MDFHAATLTVRDTTPPSATVTVARPAAGFLDVDVRGTDAGIGVATMTASVDGQPVVTRAFDPTRCQDLSPFDGTIDLSLSAGCARTSIVALRVDTRAFAEGAHQLEIRVVDGAGNVHVSQHVVEVQNPPATSPAPVPTAIPTAVPTAAPTATPRVPTVRELVRLPKRLDRLAHRHARAQRPVPEGRRADLPAPADAGVQGREIGTGRGTSTPGRRVRVTIKLTRAAQRTLKRKRVARRDADRRRRPPPRLRPAPNLKTLNGV